MNIPNLKDSMELSDNHFASGIHKFKKLDDIVKKETREVTLEMMKSCIFEKSLAI